MNGEEGVGNVLPSDGHGSRGTAGSLAGTLVMPSVLEDLLFLADCGEPVVWPLGMSAPEARRVLREARCIG